jgi:hypothetical protein
MVTRFAVAMAFSLTFTSSADAPARRWFYCSQNLLVDENVARVEALLRRAAKAGYNGVLLADYKFNVLDRMDERYFGNVERVKRVAAEVGIEIVPAVFSVGYSSGILAHDPNLAEGLPVRDAPFVVRAGRVTPNAAPLNLANGDFEESDGDTFKGWTFQDAPGQTTFADRTTTHSGATSLRMERFRASSPEHGHGRIHQILGVEPFRQYHLSVWVKGAGIRPASEVRVAVLTDEGRSLNHADLGVAPTQEWKRHDVVFNSLNHNRVRLYLGIWGGDSGTLWWDDLRIEEAPFVNLIRRDGAPLRVVGDDGTVYEEGRDYEPLSDPRMGTVPWLGGYENYHEPPELRLSATTRIREGERLRVSYYHTAIIGDSQVPASLVEPKVFEILRDQAERVQALFHPNAFFMSHDEIRIAGWDKISQESGKTAGELLADNARRCVGILKELNPDARIYVWSDMFDPNHNAHDDYYLVNGSFAGSWEGLSRDVIIANWYYGRRNENMPWFQNRGHRQLFAGYYDSDPATIRVWLNDAKRLGIAVDGVMYTTWQSRYDDLEAFARAAWGE